MNTLLMLSLLVGLAIGIGIGAGLMQWQRGRKLPPDEAQSTPPSYKEEIRLLRHSVSGKLAFYRNGRFFHRFDLLDRITRERLRQLMAEIGTETKDTKPTLPIREEEEKEEPATTPLEGTLRKSRAVSFAKWEVALPFDQETQVSLSIPAQIDRILQRMISGTPLEARRVRLREGPDQSVIVLVGESVFTSVEDVPEEDIRRTIRAAVDEWERRARRA
jgi:uncharacterized protein YneF (UPF0154 family)